MTRYERVQQILENAVQGEDVSRHGNFWRDRTRDQFAAYSYRGLNIIAVGDGAGSNLVKALKGETPFADDPYPQMPVGFPPMPPEQIAFIELWIEEGCLEDDMPGVATGVRVADAPPFPGGRAARHLAYWREFDRWSMFEATREVNAAIDAFFNVVARWMAFARDAAQEPAWVDATRTVEASLAFLSPRQVATVHDFYGDPPELPLLLESYERFGAGTFPPDLERPEDSAHQMNGATMWFIWFAFADACLRRGVDAEFWATQARVILLGMLNDGVFRSRFRVTGFSADPAGQEAMRAYVTDLASVELPAALRLRYREALG